VRDVFSHLKLGRSIIWILVGFIVIHHGFFIKVTARSGCHGIYITRRSDHGSAEEKY
jgi:hypothetical protein